MPRPKTKSQLLEQSQKNYAKLLKLVDSYGPAEQEKDFSPGTLNRNIRDVLAHLHEWHLMMLSWHEVGMTGGKPHMPAEGYTWRSVPMLNTIINEKYKATPLSKARQLFDESYSQLRAIIMGHTDEELFTKKKYKWTGSTSLASYLISATASHYDWAYKLIKKNLS